MKALGIAIRPLFGSRACVAGEHPDIGYGARSASASAPGVGGDPHARGFLP